MSLDPQDLQAAITRLLRPLSGGAALLAGMAGSGSSWSPSRGSTVSPGAASGATSMSRVFPRDHALDGNDVLRV